jgi:hypothetical protein
MPNILGSARYSPRERAMLGGEVKSRSNGVLDPRTVSHLQLLAGGLSTPLGRVSRFSSLARLPSVDGKDAESDNDRRLFPSWCAFLAPVGVVILLWGWNQIRNDTNMLSGRIAFGVGAIF